LISNSVHLADVLRPAVSEQLMLRAGYASEDIDDLHSSGILAIDLDAIAPEQIAEILGSDPPSIVSPDVSWSHFEPIGSMGHVALADFYTGALFPPVALKPCGLFGPSGLWPPPMQPFAVDLSLPYQLRNRFNRIPRKAIFSHSQLEYELSLIRSRLGPGAKLFFRGQTSQYFVHRKPKVASLLYGHENVREPSLPSSAFRHHFDYVSAERHWKTIIADIDYRVSGFVDRQWWVEEQSEHIPLGSDGNIASWHSVSTMALAQHYGLPTFGLDVTASLDMAWWFATHKYHSEADVAWYTPYLWAGEDFDSWPAIYVFRCADWNPIDNLDLPAERPRRQKAVLARGSWGFHGNIVADDLIAVFALAPDLGAEPSLVVDVFPNVESDQFFAELLALKSRLGRSHPLNAVAGLDHIFRIEERSTATKP